jgi:hypothetical protein
MRSAARRPPRLARRTPRGSGAGARTAGGAARRSGGSGRRSWSRGAARARRGGGRTTKGSGGGGGLRAGAPCARRIWRSGSGDWENRGLDLEFGRGFSVGEDEGTDGWMYMVVAGFGGGKTGREWGREGNWKRRVLRIPGAGNFPASWSSAHTCPF